MTDSHSLWTYLIPGITFGFAAAAQPGPLMAYFISSTLQSGWKKTFPAIFSPLLTDGPIALLCLVLLGNLPPFMLDYVRIAGGLFLLYLAWQSARRWQKESGFSTTGDVSSGRTILQSSVVNLLNPGPYLGWSLVMGPLLIESWKLSPLWGFSLVAGFYLTLFAVSALLIILFHQARNSGPKVRRLLGFISILFLLLLGIYQVISGIRPG
jgi:threonine/homoserine/homoserine lactone efflux protein